MFHEPDRNDDHDVIPAAEQTALEALLRRLQPSPPQIDRDRLMFAAGQASVEWNAAAYIARPIRHGESVTWSASLARRFWPAATALTTAASVILAVLLFQERRATHESVVVESKSPPSHVSVVPTAIAAHDPPSSSVDTDTVLFPWLAWPGLDEPTSGYLATRNAALSQGLAAIDWMTPSSDRGDHQSADGQEPATAQELLQEYLPQPTSSPDTSS